MILTEYGKEQRMRALLETYKQLILLKAEQSVLDGHVNIIVSDALVNCANADGNCVIGDLVITLPKR